MTIGILVGLGAFAVVWLAAMPRDARGRWWHVVHAVLPLVAYAALGVLPAGILMQTWAAWLDIGLMAGALLALAWLIGTATRNHGVMDIAYNVVVVCIAWFAALRHPGPLSWTAMVVVAMVTLWGGRLAVQTFGQNHRTERQPYAVWRLRGGRRWIWWSLFQVYALQGVTLWVWTLGIVFAVYAPGGGWATLAGAAVWATGFLIQTIADVQLTHFRRDERNRGGILATGLWAVARQPNYLGEAVMWWGYSICALDHPAGAIGLVSAVYVTWFLGFGSAGPFKEAHMKRTRGLAWEEYCRRTPRFFPLPRPRGA